jgi:hypothetical protein
MGYDPGADVQSVAAEFTQYPMDLQVPSGLSGLGRFLGATTNVGLIERLRAKYHDWRMEKDMQKAIIAQAREDRRQTPMPVPSVAYAQVGPEIAAGMITEGSLMANLLRSGMPENYARAQAATSWRAWQRPYWERG